MTVYKHNTFKLKFIIFSVFPIVVSLLFHLLWKYRSTYNITTTTIPLLTIVLNVIIIPIYLISNYNYFVLKQNISLILSIP